MKIKLIITSILCLFIIANSCRHKPDLIITGNGNTPTVSDSCSKDTVYFNRDILPILQSNCAMALCHDAITAREGVILTDYTSIVTTGRIVPGNSGSSKLYRSITGSGGDLMPRPPKTPLTTDQVNLIKKWIDQGAKNNYCVECDSTAILFNANILPLIQVNCTGCHSGTTPSGSIYLRNYADVKSTVDLNKLQNVITWTGTKNMPPSAKLQDCKINNIFKWIANGALNN